MGPVQIGRPPKTGGPGNLEGEPSYDPSGEALKRPAAAPPPPDPHKNEVIDELRVASDAPGEAIAGLETAASAAPEPATAAAQTPTATDAPNRLRTAGLPAEEIEKPLPQFTASRLPDKPDAPPVKLADITQEVDARLAQQATAATAPSGDTPPTDDELIAGAMPGETTGYERDLKARGVDAKLVQEPSAVPPATNVEEPALGSPYAWAAANPEPAGTPTPASTIEPTPPAGAAEQLPASSPAPTADTEAATPAASNATGPPTETDRWTQAARRAEGNMGVPVAQTSATTEPLLAVGAPPNEPPKPSKGPDSTSTTTAAQDVQNEILSAGGALDPNLIEDMRVWKRTDFDTHIGDLQDQIDGYRVYIKDARYPPDKKAAAQGLLRKARREQEAVTKEYEKKFNRQHPSVAEANPIQNAEELELQNSISEGTLRAGQLARSSIDDLKIEKNVIQAQIDAQEARKRGAKPKEIEFINNEIRRLRAEQAAVDQSILGKEPKTTEEALKVGQAEAERLKREQSTSVQIQTEITRLTENIGKLEKKFEAETDPTKKLAALEALNAARSRLGIENEALKNTQARERAEGGIKTRAEFDAMSNEEQARYLVSRGPKVAETIKYDKKGLALTELQNDLLGYRDMDGEAGIDKQAQYVDSVADHLVTKGRKGMDFKTFHLIASKYPGIREAVVQRVLSSDAGKEVEKLFPKGKLGSLVEKARNHPGLMAVILSIIVGMITAGPVGLVGGVASVGLNMATKGA